MLVLLDKWHEEIEGLPDEELRIWTATITDTLSLTLQKTSDSNVRHLLLIKEEYPRLYQMLVEYEQGYTL